MQNVLQNWVQFFFLLYGGFHTTDNRLLRTQNVVLVDSCWQILTRARMKMKNAGDIFTASSMGWGGGGVNIVLTLQISLGMWGKKKTCVHRLVCCKLKEIFEIPLQVHTWHRSNKIGSCSSLVSVSCVPVSKPSLSWIYHQEGLIYSKWMNTLQMNSDSCIQFLSSSEKHKQWRSREINK